MAHGGKRSGSGRKKGFSAIKAEGARAYFAERVGASLEPIIDALVAKAVAGDIRAAQTLFERAYGRPHAPEGEPSQQVEVTVIKYAERKQGLS